MSTVKRSNRVTTSRRGIRKAMTLLADVPSGRSHPETADQRRVRYSVAEAQALHDAADAVLTSRSDATVAKLVARLATLQARIAEARDKPMRAPTRGKAKARMRVIVDNAETGERTVYADRQEAGQALRVKPASLSVLVSKGKGVWRFSRPHPETGNPMLLELRIERPLKPSGN